MTTDISVTKVSFQVEKRDWLLSPHGTDPGTTPSVTLDPSKFVKADHYPNGYIPSGIALGKITASGLYGPYDDAASDGTQTATGLLFSSVNVTNPDGSIKAKVGGAQVVHAFVDPAKLPIGSGKKGYLDANGQADLKLIHFATGA